MEFHHPFLACSLAPLHKGATHNIKPLLFPKLTRTLSLESLASTHQIDRTILSPQRLLRVGLGKGSSNNSRLSSFLRNSIRVMNGHQLFRCPRPTIARTTGAQKERCRSGIFHEHFACDTALCRKPLSTKYFRRLISAGRRALGLVLLLFSFGA